MEPAAGREGLADLGFMASQRSQSSCVWLSIETCQTGMLLVSEKAKMERYGSKKRIMEQPSVYLPFAIKKY